MENDDNKHFHHFQLGKPSHSELASHFNYVVREGKGAENSSSQPHSPSLVKPLTGIYRNHQLGQGLLTAESSGQPELLIALFVSDVYEMTPKRHK